MTGRKAGQEVAAPSNGSTAVAVAAPPLPLEIARGTVRIPKLKKGEPQSAAVADQQAKLLDIYTTTGNDDTKVQVLAPAIPKQGTKPGDEVRFHVLSIEEGRSESIDNQLVTYKLQGGRWWSDFEDHGPMGKEYVTQKYLVCLPEVDPDTPYELLLYKSSLGAARNINTALSDVLGSGGTQFDVAFDLSVVHREKGQYKFGVWVAKQAEADPEHVKAAAELGALVASFQPAVQSAPPPADTPDI